MLELLLDGAGVLINNTVSSRPNEEENASAEVALSPLTGGIT
jgi:hypothetical protein